MGEPQSGVRGLCSGKRGKDGANPVNALRRVNSEANEVSGAIRLRSNRPSEARGSVSWFYLSLVFILSVFLSSQWFCFAQSKLYLVGVSINRLSPVYWLDILCPVVCFYLTQVVSPPLNNLPLRD